MPTKTSSKPVFAEISEDEKHIEIWFKYDRELVDIMHKCHAEFIPEEKGGPKWHLPLVYEEVKRLVNGVGRERLDMGAAILDWGRSEKEKDDQLIKVIDLKDAQLERLPKKLPKLNKFLRDYQRAAAYRLRYDPNFMIADQPGLGKTVEAIAGIFEANLEGGAKLIIAPLSSHETVWLKELRRWQKQPVLIAEGGRVDREEVLKQAIDAANYEIPFWLVINPHMVMMKKDGDEELDGGVKRTKLRPNYPELYEIEWSVVVADEVHKGMLRNPRTVTSQGMNRLKSVKRIPLSGTPMGGRPMNLWGILHWMEPKQFTSQWRWAKQWLDVFDNGFGWEVGDIKEGKQEDFYRHISPFIVRRTKEEVLKELPPKQRIDIWCDMTEEQDRQYLRMARQAEIVIADETITAQGILAQYVRLKQFAGAKQDIVIKNDQTKLVPTYDSGKLNALIEKLDEIGIMEGETDTQAVIFSQFESMARMVYNYLTEHNVNASIMTGLENKAGQRAELQNNFQAGKAKVMIMTTQTGGVSITLDKADYAFILDEMWNPDDQSQAEDRIHRASRIHQVTIYYLRTKETVEEYIMKVTGQKQLTNKMILDDRRKIPLYNKRKAKSKGLFD